MIDNTSHVEFNIVTDLINIDNKFKQVAESDFNISDQNMTTTVASITTREIQSIDSPFNDLFMKVDIPEAYRVDAKSFIERPFFVDEVTFPDTAARYTLLTNTVRFLPGDIARSNESVLNMFKMAAYGRPDLVINVSMAGTITHAGCVLVGVLPPFPAYPTLVQPNNKKLINTILTGPHAFLHANEATSVAIPVPWYCNTDLATTDMEQRSGYDTTLDITVTNGNYATLVFLVLNPLLPSEGSTKSLRIIVEACFKNFDLAVPTPRFVTWTAQSGNSPSSFYNPNYEDFDRLAKEYKLTNWIQATPEERHKIRDRLLRYAPLVGGTVSLLAVLVRLGFSCLTGADPGEPIDYVLHAGFEPQSGVINSLGRFATGLLDSTASGLKTITSDAIDTGRGLIRDYTGLHNPNIPVVQERIVTTQTNFVNNTDCPQFFEKLDPFTKFNRIVKEPIFGSAIDEMAVSNIVTKKQLIGTITVSVNDGVGAMKWARPISPYQGGLDTVASVSRSSANNIELLHTMSRAWRGDLKLTIQSVMNNKQQCKLKVVKMYNPSVKVTSNYPVYKSVVNAPTHLLEFTEGGQEHVVDLPYLCRNDITPCASNTDTEALFHGLYYIYVAQPLVISDSSPNSVEFNIYMSGSKNLTFYGYTTANTYHDNFGIIPTPLVNRHHSKVKKFASVTRFMPNFPFYRFADNEHNTQLFIFLDNPNRKGWATDLTKWNPTQKEEFNKYVKDNAPAYQQYLDTWNQVKAVFDDSISFKKAIDTWKYDVSKKCVSVELSALNTHQIIRLKDILGIDELHSFKSQSGSIKVMNEPQHQTHTTREDDEGQYLGHMTRLMPSLDIRHFVRRMYKSQVYTAGIDQSNTLNTSIQLSTFLGENPSLWNYTPIETFSRMYYGKSVGFKFRLMLSIIDITPETVAEIDSLNLRLYYIPQNVNALVGSKVVVTAPPNVNSFLSPFSSNDVPPSLPFQILGKESTKTHVVYEFSVPDTSFYKFMGGPNKFYSFDSNANVPSVSQTDFGSLLLQFTNLDRVKSANFSFELFVGLTDESRFGYHSIAPPFVVRKTSGTYLGSDADANAPPPAALNPYIYRGGFL